MHNSVEHLACLNLPVKAGLRFKSFWRLVYHIGYLLAAVKSRTLALDEWTCRAGRPAPDRYSNRRRHGASRDVFQTYFRSSNSSAVYFSTNAAAEERRSSTVNEDDRLISLPVRALLQTFLGRSLLFALSFFVGDDC